MTTPVERVEFDQEFNGLPAKMFRDSRQADAFTFRLFVSAMSYQTKILHPKRGTPVIVVMLLSPSAVTV